MNKLNNVFDIDTVKSNITNNKTFQNLSGIVSNSINSIDIDKSKLSTFYYTHKNKIIYISLSIIILWIYFSVFFRRVSRCLNRMNSYNLNIVPLEADPNIVNSDFRLCDFYIASSFKSYLPCTNYYDYASIDSIIKVIECGARYIQLDIMNNNFNPDTDPVICNGNEVGNWHYTTSLSFDDTIKKIVAVAFNGSLLTNPSDPLFIHLNFKTWGNKSTINKCAHILKKYLNYKFMPVEFAYQGRFSSTNISTALIKQFIDKVIIITTGDISNTDMDEISNITSEKGLNLREVSYDDILNSYDLNEITEFNKKNLTIVNPNFTGRTKQNFNYLTPYYTGCQFIAMNYTSPDKNMLEYIDRFKSNSILLKPYKLRYHPVSIQQPLQQDKRVSFEPKQISTPNFTIMY